MICRLFPVLFIIMGSYAHGDQLWAKANFSFGLPFYAVQSDPCPKYPEGLCLADSVSICHTNVILVSQITICSARTEYRFHYDHPGGGSFEATLLEGAEECPGGPVVAVVGVDANIVRLIPSKTGQWSLPKDVELKARQRLQVLLETKRKSEARIGDIDLNRFSDSAPEILTIGEARLLIFHWLGAGNGPFVWFVKGNLFPLAGICTWKPLFFSVQNKLHLAYTAQDFCGSGQRILYVYDLSGDAPRKVYENENLSD